jgi:ABC-type nitrate/sulfonate/bicarbonate transport system ATPase subunit
MSSIFDGAENASPNQRYWYTETLLKLENVSLTLGDTLILRDINLEVKDIHRQGVQQGQVIGFFGKSGIGKTKLSEILSGLRPPTTGAVAVGNPLQPVVRGRVGMVQQHYPLFQHRTVYGNLEVATEVYGTPKEERKDRIMGMLEKFNMADRDQLYPSQLSGGQRQRVAIAQQLLCSDHYIILDEPFSGLDVEMIDKVSALIQGIATSHEENTVIIVSHDLSTTAALSDHLWVMGRERDEATQAMRPGATILQQYDLADMDLCWQPNIEATPRFAELVGLIKHNLRAV